MNDTYYFKEKPFNYEFVLIIERLFFKVIRIIHISHNDIILYLIWIHHFSLYPLMSTQILLILRKSPIVFDLIN